MQKKVKLKKKEAIIFLGTGLIQSNTIRIAKRKFFTIGFDKNQKSTGKKYCDLFFKSSANNFDFILKKLKKFSDLKFKLIWSNNDIFLYTRSKLENILEVQFKNSNKKTIDFILDKSKFGKLNNKHNIIIPNLKRFKKIDKLICKPINSSGSKDIKIINNNYIKKINKKNFIFQKYHEGDEYGLNYINYKNQIFTLNNVKRYFNHNLTMVPIGSVCTNKDVIPKKVKNLIIKIINDLKILGKIKVDIIKTSNGKFKIIEISNRFHGEIDTTITFKKNGLSAFENLVNLIDSKDISNKIINKKKYYGYINLFNDKLNIKSYNKILNHNKLKFVQKIKRSKSKKYKIDSTQDVKSYILFYARRIPSNKEFVKIFNNLNGFI
jgi:hypothetical protein